MLLSLQFGWMLRLCLVETKLVFHFVPQTDEAPFAEGPTATKITLTSFTLNGLSCCSILQASDHLETGRMIAPSSSGGLRRHPGQRFLLGPPVVPVYILLPFFGGGFPY